MECHTNNKKDEERLGESTKERDLAKNLPLHERVVLPNTTVVNPSHERHYQLKLSIMQTLEEIFIRQGSLNL